MSFPPSEVIAALQEGERKRRAELAVAKLEGEAAKFAGAERIYFVVKDIGGLLGCYLDCDLAYREAKACEAVVCSLPIEADYR